MLAARSGTYKFSSGGWLSIINESSTKLSLLYLMYFARHEWKQNPTSPKVYRVGAQVYRSIRTLFVYPGNCGIFAFCTEEGCLVARVVQRVHYVVFISALLDLLPDFPVLGIVAVVAATLVSSSPQNMLSRRRQPCAAPSIIATMCKPTEPIGKVCACRYNTAAKQASTPPTQ